MTKEGWRCTLLSRTHPKQAGRKNQAKPFARKLKVQMGKMTEKGAKFYANSVTPKRREKEVLQTLQKLEGGKRYTVMASAYPPTSAKATYEKESIFPA